MRTCVQLLAAVAVLTACPEPDEPFPYGSDGDEASTEGDSSTTTGAELPSDVDETSSPSEASDTGPSPSACGDNVWQPGEACEIIDGEPISWSTCQSLGFIGGEIACADDCTVDTSSCTAPVCGNGVREGDEQCDGNDGHCSLLGYLGHVGDDNGWVPCLPDCTWDVSTCLPDCDVVPGVVGESCCSLGSFGCYCVDDVKCAEGLTCWPTTWPAPGVCGDDTTCAREGQGCGSSPPHECCDGLTCTIVGGVATCV